MRKTQSIRASIALAAASLLSSGCDLVDALSDGGSTLITVFANHHSSDVDASGDGDLRIFDNDEGWTIHLDRGVVTTHAVTLQRCDGEEAPVDFYFGTLVEDLSRADFDRQTLGGTEVGASEFCGLEVSYGPFSADRDVAPPNSDASAMDGSTVHLLGYAQRGELRVGFDVYVEGTVDAVVDLANSPNGPLRISGNEPFPVEVTISKTYDRFFDGIDFENFDEADLAANALAVLELETHAQVHR